MYCTCMLYADSVQSNIGSGTNKDVVEAAQLHKTLFSLFLFQKSARDGTGKIEAEFNNLKGK